MKLFKIILFLAFFPLSLTALNQDWLHYIEQYQGIAVREMERTGVPASIKLAQGLLESNAGKSYLAKEANNHFGIKCGGSWKGKKKYRKDDDYDKNGKLRPSCFRAYRNAKESYIAHSEFLKDPRKAYRYGFLFDYKPTDYKRWAKGLKKAGYATGTHYANKLITIVEKYGLDSYDKKHSSEVLAESARKTANSKINDIIVTYAQKNDTPASIAERNDVSVKRLLQYNEKIGNAYTTLAPETTVFLKGKRNSYRGKQKWHTVRSEETMYSISQSYGIKLKKLYKRNRMANGTEPASGERIKLKGKNKKRPQLREKNASPTIIEKEEKSLDLDETMSLDDFEPPVEEITAISNEELINSEEENVGKEIIEGDTIAEAVTLIESEIIDRDEDTTPIENTEQYYTVKKGDTLWAISKRYEVSVEKLRLLNEMENNLIHLGQKLRVE